jgi:chromosome segregation ATPase
MHRDERQHEQENTIMERDNEHDGRDSGCNTASCYAKKIKQARIDLNAHIKSTGRDIDNSEKEIEKLQARISWLKEQKYSLEHHLDNLA